MSLSHSFNVQVASDFGIEIALFLNHFQFWHNRAKNNAQNFHKNKVWVRLSAEQIQEIYPYFTLRQIRYYLQKMVELNLLIKGEFNIKKSDRTKWYNLTKKAQNLLNIKPVKVGDENVSSKGDENVIAIDENVTSKYKEVDISNRYILLLKEIEGNYGLIETLAMQNRIEKNEVIKYAKIYVKQKVAVKQIYNNATHFYSAFTKWLSEEVSVSKRCLKKEVTWFVDMFNKISRSEFQVSEKIEELFAKQFAVGFTGDQMRKAVTNLYSSSPKNDFHLKSSFKFATPEYLLKDGNMNKYLNFKI
jgi:hypothetical protein